MFIENFQGTYERSSTAETLKTIRQKHDESLHDYVKHFYNARNVIPYIQDIEIINAFRDGVNNIKTVEEIAMKKPKTVIDLLVVVDTCIEASEAGVDFLSLVARGPQRRSRMTEKSTRLIEEISRIMETADTISSSPRIRKRRGLSVALTTQRSGVRSIAPQDMI
jgi:hypothetical protein